MFCLNWDIKMNFHHMNPELLCVQMNDCLMGDGCGEHTEVPDNLPDHVFEHPSAVLGVEEGQELHLVQQLVIWVGVRLVPAVLQTLQHLLGCIHKTNIVTASMNWQLWKVTKTHFLHSLSSSSFRSSLFFIFSATSFSLKPLLAKNLALYSSHVT